MSIKTWVIGENVLASDLNANFAETAVAGHFTAVAGEAISAGDAVCAGYYQADGGILYDTKAATHGTLTTGGGTVTLAITVANNTNRVLIVTINNNQALTPYNVTFNGDAMSAVTNESYGSGTSKLTTWVLFAPDVGTYNVSFTLGSAGGGETYAITAYSYYNVAQAVDASGDMNNDSGNMSLSITPTVDGCLIFSSFGDNGTEAIASIVNCANNQSVNVVNQSLTSGDSGFVYPKKATTISADTGDYGAVASIVLAPITAPTLNAVLKATSAVLANACNLNKAEHFIGFAVNAISAGASGLIQTNGVFTTSGLSAFYTYYLSTAGAIATSAGAVSKKIGIALSTTKLLIKHDNS